MFAYPRLIALAALAISTPALAQDDSPEPDNASLTIGAAGVWLPEFEGARDNRFRPAPAAMGNYKGMSFLIAGNRASVDLVPNGSDTGWDVQVGPVATINLNRTTPNSISEPRVRALGKLGTAIEVGGYVGITRTGVITSAYDTLNLSLSYRQDVNGVHRSGILQPTITYLTPLSTKTAVAVLASAEHVDGDYARTYFGVTPAQSVASGLAPYTPGGGWKNYTIGTLGTVALTGDLLHGLKLVVAGGYTRLLGDIARSPIVRDAGRKTQWLGAAGLAYTF